ncbi:hypothetical protein CALVIDRAFT_559837 [Calocera viscosa TUFC12733]|uniref:Uncharacterized protein n=1 Tax=Calocera viscosa (strain TUFC12733) TaxID=1330018 RepID=A0A167RRU0_CALVF|nr:hypothetical protein CALVIDRAFT_559837 [Calocera viscosa TUFC12733]
MQDNITKNNEIQGHDDLKLWPDRLARRDDRGVPTVALLRQALPFLHLSPSGALYFPLPAPQSHNILTGPDTRIDGPAIVKAWNDPLIYRWTVGPSFPYLLEHAQEMRQKNVKTYETAVGRMCELAANEAGKEIKLDQTPLRFIREVGPSGSWMFIGDVGPMRCRCSEEHPLKEREKLSEENNAR